MQERNALNEIRDKIAAPSFLEKNRKAFYFREWYMSEFKPPKGARILDVGGYVGATAIHYTKLGHEVTSIEGAPLYCAVFRERAPEIDLRECLFEEFDEPEAYDAACCTEVLNMVDDPAKTVEMLHRSLKPGGLVFVTVTQRLGIHHARRYTVTTLREQMVDFDVDVKLWEDGIHEPQIIARGCK